MMNRIALSLSLITISLISFGQKATIVGQDTETSNPIRTAVPFLTITPESRAGGMGDVGVATTPDNSSIQYNVAKYLFSEQNYGLSISYTPWLTNLGIHDINLLNVAGFSKLNEMQTISGSLTYFSLGNIQFLDDFGEFVKDYTPNEFNIKMGYSRLLTDQLSMGISLGYAYSNLTGGYSNSSTEVTAGNSFVADVGFYYNNDIEVSGYDANYALGLSIKDIGNTMSYSEGAEKSFLPTTMRLGGAFTIDLDDYNSIMTSVEFSKLLVPTPPIYYAAGEVDENGDTVLVGGEYIKAGKSSDVSVGTGMFQSFYDAPGIEKADGSRNVVSEELKEIMWSVGLEYWYAKQFALRGGYFHESTMKGNRKYFSMGLGLKYNVFGFDFAYLIPVNGKTSPLANTLRFSISFNFVDTNKSK
ncbi:MAG: type IX secretion system outer membrane channel protein PorV [Bacteroidales bacterium]|nr:type IX secretion system outer membrane channel protein PorV [Bacteroidales bacterium]